MKVRINLHELFNTLGTHDFEEPGRDDPNIQRVRKHLVRKEPINYPMSELVLVQNTNGGFVIYVEDCTVREMDQDLIVSDAAFFDRDGKCEVAPQKLVNKFLLDKIREDEDAGK